MDGMALAQAWLRLPQGTARDEAIELLYRATERACAALSGT